jgi:hypothetical protein
MLFTFQLIGFDGFNGGRRGEDNGRRLAKDNLVLPAKQRQVCARRSVVRHVPNELTP